MRVRNFAFATIAVFSFFLPVTVFSAPPPPPPNLTVTVQPTTGTYTVASAATGWTFSGAVPAPLSGVTTGTGKDAIGRYLQTSFRWNDGHPFIGTIRTYSGQSIVRFFIQSPEALSGPTPNFPSFAQFPRGLHALSYRDDVFSPHSFSLEHTSTPWIMFDDSGQTAVLSPASDFMVSQMYGAPTTFLASGIVPTIAALPAGFAHQTLLTVGNGIESTVHQWGDALTALSAKSRPNDDSDLMLKYLGYWTDNGAVYYYNYDPDKGYAGTLLAVRDEYRRENIPLHYMQLDSWWYQKTTIDFAGHVGGSKNPSLPVGTWNAYGGTLDYSASPALFPNGLAKFHQDLGLPFVVHGRWIDPTSPYHATYKISGIAPVDPLYWDSRAKYLAQSGVFCYEQDWLVDIYKYSPEMATSLDIANAFTDNMARATKANGETMQYCMPTPRFFMQGSTYGNLDTIRTSDDRFRRTTWDPFLYTSILADALHIRPWTDVLMSTEEGNLLIADLSSGPVGIGDEMGTESAFNLSRVIRSDGAIVKPDAPLLPTDATILNDVKNGRLPLIASTYTQNGQQTVYVVAFTRLGDSSAVSFTPSSFGLTGKVYVTSLDGTAKELDSSTPFTDTLGLTGWNYYTIAPVGQSGIAFLGDLNKFVGTGRQRIASITDSAAGLTAKVVLTSGDQSVTLYGYSQSAPSVTVEGANTPVQYDSQSTRFTFVVKKTAGATADGEGVTDCTVTMKATPN